MSPAWLAQSRKALVALGGALGEAVALGVLHGNAQTLAVLVLAGLTAAGVYQAPNAPKP
jgi:hypothetical protein